MDVMLPTGTQKNDAFYFPFDAVTFDPESLCSLSYLIDKQLAPNVGRNLVLVDACRNNPGHEIEGKVIALPEGTAVMFSCRKGQRSVEHDELKHGLFTFCVLEGLYGAGAKDGEIAWSDFVSHVNRRMASRDITQYIPPQREQEPITAGGVGFTVMGKQGNRKDCLEGESLARPNSYVANVTLGWQDLQSGDVARAVERLNSQIPDVQHDPRGFDWHYAWSKCEDDVGRTVGHTGPVTLLQFSPESINLASAGEEDDIPTYGMSPTNHY